MPRSAECIAFANHKGGSGKTTSCLSIAGYLAKSGSKVLVVDFDPQANATSGLRIDMMTLKYSMYDAVLDQCDGYVGMPITQVMLETGVENLYVAPFSKDGVIGEIAERLMGSSVSTKAWQTRLSELARWLVKKERFYSAIVAVSDHTGISRTMVLK